MNKSDHTILVWVLSWAGVLLALLYSPIGSPDLYHPQKYFAANMGVDFSKITIINAPMNGYVSAPSSSELIVPMSDRASTHSYNYSVNATGQTVLRSAGAVRRPSRASYANRQGRVSAAANSASAGSAGGGNSMTYNTQRGVSSSNQNPEVVISIPQLDLNLFSVSDSTFQKSADSNLNSTESQPQKVHGLTSPDGSPIEAAPIGDGWVFLIILAAIYGIFKCNVIGLLAKSH
jgi:hypothetical protein